MNDPFLLLHYGLSGLSILIRIDAIDSINAMNDGRTSILLQGGSWRTVNESFATIEHMLFGGTADD